MENEEGFSLRDLRRNLGPPRPAAFPVLPNSSGNTDSASYHAVQVNAPSDDNVEGGIEFLDPVWGKPNVPAGHSLRPCELVTFLCCPCCLGGVMHPHHVEIWRRIFRRLCVILTAVQIIFFLISIAMGGILPLWGRNANPLIGPDALTLVRLGAKETYLIKYNWQIWRLFSPILLHGGVLHLIMNLFSQMRMGLVMEERWGARRFALVYFMAGVGGNLLSCVVNPVKPGVGASGALYGIMGGWLSDVVCTWDQRDPVDRVVQLVQVVLYSILGMVISLVPIVDWAAHLGGFVFGAMLVTSFMYAVPTPQTLEIPLSVRLRQKIPMVLQVLAVALLVLLFVLIFTPVVSFPKRYKPLV